MEKDLQKKEQKYQNQESIRTFKKKENSKVLEGIGSRYYKIGRKEEKKNLPQANEKASRKQAMQQKSHQNNKHWGRPFCRILGIILMMDKQGTQTNGSNDKKVEDHAHGFTSERWHR